MPILILVTGFCSYLFSQNYHCWSYSETKSIFQVVQFSVAAIAILSMGPFIRKYVFRITTPFFEDKIASMFDIIKTIIVGIVLSQMLVQMNFCMSSKNNPMLLTYIIFIGIITLIMIIGLIGYMLLYGIGALIDGFSLWSTEKFMNQHFQDIKFLPAYIKQEMMCIPEEELENLLM